MAFNKTSSTERYIGLSTDTKPSAPIGSEFWEYDTGIVYACYDGTNWAVKVDYTVPSVTANQGTVGASPWLVTESSAAAILAKLPAALAAGGGLKVEGVAGGVAQPVTVGAGTEIIGATKDAGANWTSVLGVSGATVVSADITSATAVTDAPTSGQKIVIDDIVVSTDTEMNILFEEETSGTDIFKLFLPANGSAQITTRGKVKLATANKKLTAKASVAGNVGITVSYHSEA